jgi:hypothetical protein
MSQPNRNPAQAMRQQRKRTDMKRIAISGAATFSVMLGLITAQVATGNDPSLGHGVRQSKAAAQVTQTTAALQTGEGDDGYSEASYQSPAAAASSYSPPVVSTHSS